jgi:hypothetical protein
MTDRSLPIGFSLKPVETAAGGTAYTVEVPQAESLDAVLAYYESIGKNANEVLLAIWNSGNEQGAKQGQKEQVRKAGTDATKIAEAIAAHQETARGFIQGAPRGGGGGVKHESGYSKKDREALGNAVAMHMATSGAPPTTEEMAEICESLGIDVKHLG